MITKIVFAGQGVCTPQDGLTKQPSLAGETLMRLLSFIRTAAIDLCLGCRHQRVTRPFTIEQESYLVCLDCGRQLFYSLETMRRISAREQGRLRAARGLKGVSAATAQVQRTTQASNLAA